jgi:glycosyltransferase involved in cell wall biosynthesis
MLGVVVIGRNEGDRLVRCLESVRGQGTVVYVDSGSSDQSVFRARDLFAEVVELDLSSTFTAARARNAGLTRLQDIEPGVQYVQFVDGDCEIDPGWISAALSELLSEPHLAAVCGRLRERAPEASLFNLLCQMEWDGPLGDIASCGGVAMYRMVAFNDAGGFLETMSAGEEPELCFRLRRLGWGIRRVSHDMAVHDAAMFSWRQWFIRVRRGGQAYAACHWIHQGSGFRRREVARALLWGIAIPCLTIAAAIGTLWNAWLVVFVMIVVFGSAAMVIRTTMAKYRQGTSLNAATIYGMTCFASKFPEAIGILQFHFNRLRNRPPRVLEYRTIHAQRTTAE